MARRKAIPLGEGWYSYQTKKPSHRGGHRRQPKTVIRRTNYSRPHQPTRNPNIPSLIPIPQPQKLTLTSRNPTAINPTNPLHHLPHSLPNHTARFYSQAFTPPPFTMLPPQQRPPMPNTRLTRPHNPIPQPPPPGPTFQQALTAPPPHPQPRYRFQQPIWQYFMRQDPNLSPEITTATHDVPLPLPLPPDPMHPAWKGRCFNCLIFGHDQNDCREPDRVCAICWQKGHQAKNCRGPPPPTVHRLDPLQPRGHLEGRDLPPNRPAMLNVFVPETTSIREDINCLHQAVVFDARLKPNHAAIKLQAILMATCQVDVPFRITQLSNHQYLVLLLEGTNRSMFLESYSNQLNTFGYIPYQWNIMTNGKFLQLSYKVWVKLAMASPLGWNIETLLPITSTFGALLDHTPLVNTRSIHDMVAVVAVPNLQEIPHAIRTWMGGIAWEVGVSVMGWVEEPIELPGIVNSTPTQQMVEEIAAANSHAMIPQQADNRLVPVDFDVLFDMWESMEPGEKKNSLGATLRASPCYAVREKRTLLKILRDEQERQLVAAAAVAEKEARSKTKGKQPMVLEGSTSGGTGGNENSTSNTLNQLHVPGVQSVGVHAPQSTKVNSGAPVSHPHNTQQYTITAAQPASIKSPTKVVSVGQSTLLKIWKARDLKSHQLMASTAKPIKAASNQGLRVGLQTTAQINREPLPRPNPEHIDLLHNPIQEAQENLLIQMQDDLQEELRAMEESEQFLAEQAEDQEDLIDATMEDQEGYEGRDLEEEETGEITNIEMADNNDAGEERNPEAQDDYAGEEWVEEDPLMGAENEDMAKVDGLSDYDQDEEFDVEYDNNEYEEDNMDLQTELDAEVGDGVSQQETKE